MRNMRPIESGSRDSAVCCPGNGRRGRWNVAGLISLIALVWLGLATSAAAQTVTPLSHFGWTEPGQDLALAQSATYHAYDGTATTGVPVTSVTCVVNAGSPDPFCTSNLPALQPGAHTVTLTQIIGGAESPRSNALSFQLVVVVQPTGLKIVKLLGFWNGGVFSSRGRSGLRRVQVFRTR